MPIPVSGYLTGFSSRWDGLTDFANDRSCGTSTAAAMLEAKTGFRRLKAYKQLPTLRAALIAQREKTSKRLNDRKLDLQLKVA
jgi:hypothetical protein